MKSKIIHIINHPPAYEEYEDKPRPKWNWDTPSGSWVGIWGYDWADQICTELSKITDEFIFEVWQPDLRADKIYTAIISDRVKHLAFPCKEYYAYKGFKKIKEYFSEKMVKKIIEYQSSPLKILIVTNLDKNKLNNEIRKTNLPMIFSFLGLPDNLYKTNFTWNPVKFLSRYANNVNQSTFLRKISYVQIGDYLPRGLNRIKKLTDAEIITSMIGVNQEYYKKVTKEKARELLKINSNDKILFTSSRLVDIKQIDKLIQVCANIADLEFKLIVSGHGTKQYEEYLNSVADEFKIKNKIIFIGYQDEQSLIQYYCAADLFINVSNNDGGPMSAWKALALEIPVMNTDVGNVYHFLASQNAGIIVPKDNYIEWEKVLREFLTNKRIPKIVDNSVIEELLSWYKISSRNIMKYKSIINEYYKTK